MTITYTYKTVGAADVQRKIAEQYAAIQRGEVIAGRIVVEKMATVGACPSDYTFTFRTRDLSEWAAEQETA